MSLGHQSWTKVRLLIQNIINANSSPGLTLDPYLFIPIDENISMELPCNIGDYTDFYASEYHATNVGILFRGKDHALPPNWYKGSHFVYAYRKHLPIGYHGRASSILVSGTEIQRPKGIIKTEEALELGPTRKLDFELEIGLLIGVGNELGKPIDIESAHKYLFGFVLLNDWSARDIQAFEYVPLGPFLGKSFATTISPWIITAEALAPFSLPIEKQELQSPAPLSHLRKVFGGMFDIDLEVEICTASGGSPTIISKTNASFLYWDFLQMVTHHSSNGCNLRAGDLCGSGTISGNRPGSLGCLLEMSQNGKQSIPIDQGARNFLENGDSVVFRGYCTGEKFSIGFGDCIGKISSY